MAHPQYTAEQVIAAIQKTKGMLTLAAAELNCSPQTVHKYVNKYPTVREAVNQAREKQLDFTELKLFEAIQHGELSAIIFYLKTIGKRRGYIERTEQWTFSFPPDLMVRFVQAVERMGWSAADVLEDYVRQLDAANPTQLQDGQPAGNRPSSERTG